MVSLDMRRPTQLTRKVPPREHDSKLAKSTQPGSPSDLLSVADRQVVNLLRICKESAQGRNSEELCLTRLLTTLLELTLPGKAILEPVGFRRAAEPCSIKLIPSSCYGYDCNTILDAVYAQICDAGSDLPLRYLRTTTDRPEGRVDIYRTLIKNAPTVVALSVAPEGTDREEAIAALEVPSHMDKLDRACLNLLKLIIQASEPAGVYCNLDAHRLALSLHYSCNDRPLLGSDSYVERYLRRTSCWLRDPIAKVASLVPLPTQWFPTATGPAVLRNRVCDVVDRVLQCSYAGSSVVIALGLPRDIVKATRDALNSGKLSSKKSGGRAVRQLLGLQEADIRREHINSWLYSYFEDSLAQGMMTHEHLYNDQQLDKKLKGFSVEARSYGARQSLLNTTELLRVVNGYRPQLGAVLAFKAKDLARNESNRSRLGERIADDLLSVFDRLPPHFDRMNPFIRIVLVLENSTIRSALDFDQASRNPYGSNSVIGDAVIRIELSLHHFTNEPQITVVGDFAAAVEEILQEGAQEGSWYTQPITNLVKQAESFLGQLAKRPGWRTCES